MKQWMKKTLFVIAFAFLHWFALGICVAGTVLTMRVCTTNPTPPNPQTLYLNYALNILIFPLGYFGLWLSELSQQSWLWLVGMLSNGILWGCLLLNFGLCLKRRNKPKKERKDIS